MHGARDAKDGVAFISVHQPRSAEELDTDAVRKDALELMKLSQPCAIDNEHVLVDRFENLFVPAYYIFDRSHRLAPLSSRRQMADDVSSPPLNEW